jgi:hypothetical protein
MLSEAQKRALVGLARRSVAARVTGSVEAAGQEIELPSAFGVFITIRQSGKLRGCLGTLRCSDGVAREVERCAADAASNDPRFSRVTSAELPEISVEVSILGPLEEIDPADSAAIIIGRHGLVAEKGELRGLLLPQVAREWGWNVEQFLRQTCVKAGLPADAWRHGARILRFEAEVFGD